MLIKEALQKMEDLTEPDVDTLVKMRDSLVYSLEDYALEICKIDGELLNRITE